MLFTFFPPTSWEKDTLCSGYQLKSEFTSRPSGIVEVTIPLISLSPNLYAQIFPKATHMGSQWCGLQMSNSSTGDLAHVGAWSPPVSSPRYITRSWPFSQVHEMCQNSSTSYPYLFWSLVHCVDVFLTAVQPYRLNRRPKILHFGSLFPSWVCFHERHLHVSFKSLCNLEHQVSEQ